MRIVGFLLPLLVACAVPSAWDMPMAGVTAVTTIGARSGSGSGSWDEQVAEATGTWNDALTARGCAAPFSMGPDGHMVRLVPIADWSYRADYLGMTIDGRIDVRAGSNGYPGPGSLLHELGHAIGLEHTDPADGPSIMTPKIIYTTLYPRDIEAASAILGC